MKAFQTILIFSLLFMTYSQDCKNPLLNKLEIEGVNNPTIFQGLKYCKDLKNNATSCCNSETVNGFQDKINQAIDDLQGMAGDRDKSYQDAMKQSFPKLQEDLTKLNQSLEDLRKANNTVGDAAQKKFSNLTTLGQDVKQKAQTQSSQYNSFLETRVTCFETLMDIQGSAYCLACNPNYADFGVSQNGSIALAKTACDRMKKECYPYISKASDFQILHSLRFMEDQLSQGLEFINGIKPDDEKAIEKINSFQFQPVESKDPKSQPTSPPPGCESEEKCDWICKSVFNNGLILNANATLAGIPIETMNSTQLNKIIQESNGQKRILQNGDDDIIEVVSNGEDEDGEDEASPDDENDEVLVAKPPASAGKPKEWDPKKNDSLLVINITSNPNMVFQGENPPEIFVTGGIRLVCGSFGIILLALNYIF